MSAKDISYSAGYVFYKSIERDRPQLAKGITTYYTDFEKRGSRDNTVAVLQSMAQTEAEKELMALKIYFNGLVSDLSMGEIVNRDFEKQLTLAINYALQSKKIFERYYKRITGNDVEGNRVNMSDDKEGQGKITIAKVMNNYIANAFESKLSNALSKMTITSDQAFEKAVKSIITDAFVKDCVEEGFMTALQSGDWKADDEQGLLELKQEIDELEKLNPGTKNRLIEQIYQELNVGQIIDAIMAEINKGTSGEYKNLKAYTDRVQTTMRTKLTPKLGEFSEFFGAMTQNLLGSKKLTNGYLKATRTGQTGVKADVVTTLTMNVQSPNYEKILSELFKANKGAKDDEGANDKKTRSARAKNVRLTKEAWDKLSGMGDKDFLIYTNAKDYTLVKNGTEENPRFSSRGFSAGDPQNLLNFRKTWSQFGADGNKLANSIAQLLDGCYMNSDSYREAITQQLIQDLAYFLFDDYVTIGKQDLSGKNALHFLLLDGIYIPLSLLLLLVSEAVAETEKNPDQLFKVNINTSGANGGKILYNRRPRGGWTQEHWDAQRENSYNITVAAHFLTNFVELVGSLV